MKASFRGESVHKLDSKGRLSIPAPFRRELEKGDPDFEATKIHRFILVYGHADTSYLEAYSVESMARLERKIRKLPQFSDARKNATYTFLTQSMQVELDPNGRIVLPQKLRERIGAEEEVLFLGELDTFRITTPPAFEALQAELAARMVPGDPASDPYAALGALDDEDDE